MTGELLLDGLTDMPEHDLRVIADYLKLPLHTVQTVVFLAELRQRKPTP